MNDRGDLLALKTDGDYQSDRFAYKDTIGSSPYDTWVEDMNVESVLSLLVEDLPEEESNSRSGNSEELADDSEETDVEVALADNEAGTSNAKGNSRKSTDDAPRKADARVDNDADEGRIIGSGAPIKPDEIDFNPDENTPVSIAQTDLSPLAKVDFLPAVFDTDQAPGVQRFFPGNVADDGKNQDHGSSHNHDSTDEGNDPSVIEVFAGMDVGTLNQLIANAESGATVLLANGNYTFNDCIIIERDDITLRGESEEGTVLNFDFAPGEVCDAIQVKGGQKSYLGVADSAAVAGNNYIQLEDNNLVAGDTIYMFQANTREWLDANGWQNVSMEDADHRPFREVILEVERVEGDTVYFTHSIPYSMDEGEVKLNRIELLDDITLSDFSVTYALGPADGYDFSNTQPEYLRNTAVSIVGTNGASVERISITDIGSRGLVIGSSIDLEADDIFVSGSHNKGGGGNGYGILLYESNNASMTNLEVFDTRHSFITSAWSAETDNNIHVADTNRDTGFHGSPDRGNMVLVENSVLDYDVPFFGNGGSGWTIVSGAGSNHASIDPYAENMIQFGNAEGANRNDTIIADDTGVYMNGKYGYDTLIGGKGDDTLVGGTRSDTMTGGEGNDTFLLRMGDALDRITDFQFGEDGDTLVIAGNEDVSEFDDLYIYTRDGEARVRYGYNSTIILEGVDVADINPANFEFDPTGTITAEEYYGSDYGLA